MIKSKIKESEKFMQKQLEEKEKVLEEKISALDPKAKKK